MLDQELVGDDDKKVADSMMDELEALLGPKTEGEPVNR